MKKFISVLLSLLLVFSVLPMAFAYDQNQPTLLTIETKEVAEGETKEIDIQFVLSNAPELKSFSLTKLSYDKTKLKFVKGQCKADNAAISQVTPTGNAIVALNNNTDINGTVLIYTFTLLDGVSAGEIDISATFSAKTKPEGGTETVVDGIELIPGKIIVKGSHQHNFTLQIKNNDTLKDEPTCTSDAVYYYSCECGEISDKEVFSDVGSKLPHTEIAIGEAKSATCTEDGITAGIKCSVCGEVIEEQQVIKAHGHKWDDGIVTAPTCVTDGFTAYTCTFAGCGAVKIEDKVSAKGHVWDNGTVTVPANCVDAGIKTFHCTVVDCNGTKTEPISVDSNNHKTVVTDKAISATCTSTGLTEGSHCSACGKTINAQEVIAMTNHIGGTATCSHKAICDNCHKEYGELDVDNHSNIVTDKAVAATCTKKGFTEGSHCAGCGNVIIAQEEIPSLGGHKEVMIEGNSATCTEPGLTDGIKCSVCGEIIKAQEEIPALGHEDGDEDGICDICGEETKPDTDCDKNGHVDSDKDGKCDNCGDVMPEVKNCKCICHKKGFAGFIYKIIRFLWKLFGMKKVCDCGLSHY